LAFEGEMVVTNTTFVLEKFLINVFPHKDFLDSLLKFIPANYGQGNWFFRCSQLKIVV